LAKRARKKIKRKVRRASVRKVGKTNKNKLVLPIILVFVFVAVFVYIIFSSAKKEQPSGGTTEGPLTPSTAIPATVGGYCKKDSECFLSYCKGQTEDCINATQMAVYPKNCRTYSDWIIEKQDYTRCACIQSACTIR